MRLPKKRIMLVILTGLLFVVCPVIANDPNYISDPLSPDGTSGGAFTAPGVNVAMENVYRIEYEINKTNTPDAYLTANCGLESGDMVSFGTSGNSYDSIGSGRITFDSDSFVIDEIDWPENFTGQLLIVKYGSRWWDCPALSMSYNVGHPGGHPYYGQTGIVFANGITRTWADPYIPPSANITITPASPNAGETVCVNLTLNDATGAADYNLTITRVSLPTTTYHTTSYSSSSGSLSYTRDFSPGYYTVTGRVTLEGSTYEDTDSFVVIDEGYYLGINVWEKYSSAIIVNQDITISPVGVPEDAITSNNAYGETVFFVVVPETTYWVNASRPGYKDFNETYTVPSPPGIYNVYFERVLPPIANHSYAHFSVVDQTNGGLIPNAEIRLSDGQTKLTNSAGYAWFSVNNSEQINYYVSKPSGYWPAYGAMNLTADESILVALQRYTGPTATATMPGWTPVTVPTTGTGGGPVVTLSAQLREQNVQDGMDVWYTNLPFISQFLFLLFIIGGLGLMAGGTRRN